MVDFIIVTFRQDNMSTKQGPILEILHSKPTKKFSFFFISPSCILIPEAAFIQIPLFNTLVPIYLLFMHPNSNLKLTLNRSLGITKLLIDKFIHVFSKS